MHLGEALMQTKISCHQCLAWGSWWALWCVLRPGLGCPDGIYSTRRVATCAEFGKQPGTGHTKSSCCLFRVCEQLRDFRKAHRANWGRPLVWKSHWELLHPVYELGGVSGNPQSRTNHVNQNNSWNFAPDYACRLVRRRVQQRNNGTC